MISPGFGFGCTQPTTLTVIFASEAAFARAAFTLRVILAASALVIFTEFIPKYTSKRSSPGVSVATAGISVIGTAAVRSVLSGVNPSAWKVCSPSGSDAGMGSVVVKLPSESVITAPSHVGVE